MPFIRDITSTFKTAATIVAVLLRPGAGSLFGRSAFSLVGSIVHHSLPITLSLLPAVLFRKLMQIANSRRPCSQQVAAPLPPARGKAPASILHGLRNTPSSLPVRILGRTLMVPVGVLEDDYIWNTTTSILYNQTEALGRADASINEPRDSPQVVIVDPGNVILTLEERLGRQFQDVRRLPEDGWDAN